MKKVWIFGDSYACQENTDKVNWPRLLSNTYDIKNFAIGGSGPTYSLNLLKDLMKNNKTNDITVIFFISAIWRLDLKFLEKRDQHVIKFFDYDKKMQNYKKYKKQLKFILDQYILEDSFQNTELDKIIGSLKLYSDSFDRMLVWPIFNTTNIQIYSTQKFQFVEDMLFMVEPVDNDLYHDERINHLSESKHKQLYNQLCNWLDNDIKPELGKFL